MKFDNKTFQLKYEAWKNGADYWKDIRGINLGGDARAEEPTPEEQALLNNKVESVLAAYNSGKDDNMAKEIIEPMPYDTPLSEEHPILHKYKGGKNGGNNFISSFVDRLGPLVGQQLTRYGYNDDAYYNVMRLLAYESNYGRSDAARDKHNYGGVGWDGEKYTTYKSDEDFVKAYVRLMHNKYDAALRAKSTQGYARALKQKGYYEDTLQNYSRNLVGMNSLTRAAKAHKSAHTDAYNYAVNLVDLEQDYDDAQNASPIIINTPSIEQPATVRADAPNTLLGPSREEMKALMAKQIDEQRQLMLDLLTTSPLPNILTLLPRNNFGKDAYGQKFWLRRGGNMHFDEGKDPYLYPPTDYDFVQARDLGYQPGDDGHWPSRNYKTGRYLKSPTHPTLYKGIIADNSLGYYPYYQNGTIYTNTWKGNEPYTGIVENYIQHRSKKKGAKK